MTWQPIETAPRDGRAILIWEPSRDERNRMFTEDGGYVEFDHPRYAIGYWRVFYDGKAWASWGDRNNERVNPTHWQPLPAPPE
jgi:hypothetical protein